MSKTSVERNRPKAVLRAHCIGLSAATRTAYWPDLMLERDVTFLMVKLLNVTRLRISELNGLKIRVVSPDAAQFILACQGSNEWVIFVQNRGLQEACRRYYEDRAEQWPIASSLFLKR